MAIFFDAPVEPTAQTTFIRNVPLPADFTLTGLFPRQDLQTNTVDFAEIVRTNRTARYRSYDGRIHVSARDVGSEKRVSLLPLSSSLGMGEYERLQLEFARTQGTNLAALATSIYNDSENLTREVQARVEQAWGDVLTDGKLTINENGFAGEADFGVPANQLVAPAIVWSTPATATVLSDLLGWSDLYFAANGVRPATMQTSQSVIRLMQRSTEVIAAIAGTNTGRTRVTLAELNDLLDSEGLPTLRAPYGSRVDVDGVSTLVIPDGRIQFFPPTVSDLGYTAWGVSATALELVNASQVDFSFEDAPGIVGVVEKIGPPYRQTTFVDAVAMPILANARLLMIAAVL